MKKQLKTVPKFVTEEEERRFWELNDSSEYVDWKTAQQVVLPNLVSKPPLYGLAQFGGG